MEEQNIDQSFICQKCNKSFKDKRRLNAHSINCKPKETENQEESNGEDEKKTSRKGKFKSLSNDIKWMYREMGGREKLLEEAKSDSKFFKMLVEVMLRSEQRVEEVNSTKKTNEEDKGKTVFIIKGLHTDKVESGDVDIEIKQYRASVMPEREDFVEETYVENDQSAD